MNEKEFPALAAGGVIAMCGGTIALAIGLTIWPLALVPAVALFCVSCLAFFGSKL